MPTELDHEEYHPETLRPLADDIAPPDSYVRPSRAPMVIAGILVAIAVTASVFAFSSRPKLTAAAQAVLAERRQEQLADSSLSPAASASTLFHARATEELDAALPAAAKACGVTLASGMEVDVRASVPETGVMESTTLTSPPFAGWPMGDCIAKHLAKTRLSPHDGGTLPLHARLIAP
jgi:hypothetical protein